MLEIIQWGVLLWIAFELYKVQRAMTNKDGIFTTYANDDGGGDESNGEKNEEKSKSTSRFIVDGKHKFANAMDALAKASEIADSKGKRIHVYDSRNKKVITTIEPK